MKEKYKQAFMDMTEVFSKTSEARRLKVGATIVQDGRIISLAINGTPTGWDTNDCEDENGETSWFVFHAERQALNKLRKSHESCVGASMFITHSPCKLCSLEIIDSGIKEVFYKYDYRDSTGVELLKKYGIRVEKMN